MNNELRALLERITGNSHQDSLRAIGELRPLLAAPACAHTWTDDGMFTLLCTKCGETEQDLNSPEDEPAVPPAGGELPERKSAMDAFSQYGLGEVRGWNAACDAWEPHAVRLQAELAEAAQRGFIRGINAEAAARREREAAQPQGDQVSQVRSHGSDCWEDISGESLELVREQPEEYEVRTLYRYPPAPQGEQVAWIKPGMPEPYLATDPRYAELWPDQWKGLYAWPPAPVADEDWHMNPCKQGHRDVGAAGGVASCYQCDEKIEAATTQEAFELWNAAHPKQ